MASKYYYAPEISTAGNQNPASTNFLRIYPKPNGLWYEQDESGVERVLNFDRLSIQPISEPAIVIHNNPANNTFTNVVTQNVVIPFDGDYLIDVSFQYNLDSTASQFYARATFDGNALGLNDVGNNVILNKRVRNSGNTPQGAITGTGSGNEYSFGRKYFLTGLTAGTKSFVLDVGGQTGGINYSMWDVLVDITLKSLS